MHDSELNAKLEQTLFIQILHCTKFDRELSDLFVK